MAFYCASGFSLSAEAAWGGRFVIGIAGRRISVKVHYLIWGLLFGVLFWASSAVAGPYPLEAEMQEDLRSARQAVRNLLEAHGEADTEIARLKDWADNIRIIDLLVQEGFKSEALAAGPLDEAVRQRHAAAFQHFQAAISHFLALTDSLSDPPDPTVLRNLLSLLDGILPEKQYPLLGSLPYQHLRLPAVPPLSAPPIVPAYKGGAVAVQSADTLGTPEAPLSAPIVQLAESLGWNPVRIYEWVQNNIETEWYWGSMKGAEETLRQKSGNDADQAALLVALLRAANFPARYVRGVAEFFPNIDKAKSLTGLDDPLKIAALLQKAGVPFEPVIAGGKIANFRFEHIWVEAEIPYANYRGAMLDQHGKIWVPLDTHLKPAGYVWNSAADLPGDFPLAGMRDDYLATPRDETPLEYLRGRVEAHLSSPYAPLLRTRSLPAFTLGILPGSLQFGVHAITGEYAALPDELRHQVHFRATDEDGRELFAFSSDAVRFASRQLILSYEPETVQDQRIIDSYGGLDNTPAYLVHLRPVLLLDGERLLVAREGLPMGAGYRLTVTLQAPGGSTETTGQHIAGNLSAIGIACQKVVAPAERPLEEKDAARLLSEEALAYIQRWNASEEELASLLKLALIRPLPTVVTVGGVVDVTYRLDIPHGFTWKGVFIDAGLRRAEVIAKAGQEERERQFMRLSALQGSILENRLFEDDFGVASVSTAKLLALAPQNLVPLLTLDGSNINALLPTLNLAGNVREDIVNAVHQGFSVTVPEAEVAYKNWTGIGYIKENPDTGEAGYMLSGMIAGGMTAEEWAARYLRDVLQAPYGDPPNRDAQSAAHIAKITVTDRQNGTVGKSVETPLAVLVTDLKGVPVIGAQVTFTMLAGGGSFAGAATITVQTAATGIAKISPTLGIHTADNPSFQRINQGDTYATQVGVNLFTTSVTSRLGDLSIPQPFEIYGRPDVPTAMLKTFGDGTRAMVNTPAGTVKVRVVDQHGNPISNIPVTFTAKGAVSQSSISLPTNYRNIEFYRKEVCAVAFPLPGDCGTVTSLTQVSAHHGAGIETLLGNTLATRYTVEATAPGLPAVAFSLYSLGYMDEGAYLAQVFLEHLVTVNEQGVPVNAAKAGQDLPAPLTAALFMLHNGYTTEKYTCGLDENDEPIYCWRLKGSALIDIERITSNATVTFTAKAGGGTAAPAQHSGGGLYRATYTTGAQPALNIIEGVGEATLTVPEVYYDAWGYAAKDGYRSGTLPMRTVTVKSGQRLLFNRETKELQPNPNPENVIYEVYGVKVPTAIAPEIALLGDGGLARENVTVDYTIQPAGAAPDGYRALSAQIDLFAVDQAGTEAWAGYLVGDATGGNGTAIFSRGSVFDPKKRYFAQTVLNRGSGIEIRGDKMPIATLLADLDIDSDNNAGWIEDGTHKLPSRNPLEDQAEDLIGHPGKVIRPNFLDPDGDKIPGFADGLRKDGANLFGNQANSDGKPDSAPFVPVVIEIAGSAFDPAKAKITFGYPGSDPAQVQKGVDAKGEDRYTPATGSLRLWSKDGSQTRNAEDIAATAGGDYIVPDKAYTFNQLGSTAMNGGWRLYLEGLTASNGTGDQRIVIQIDPDGDGPLPVTDGDAVRATAPLVGLIADYSHNREIDDEDRNRAARGDTFYFWINDDDDSGETGGDDIPIPFSYAGTSNSPRDCDNKQVDGVRDLVDFFPVALDIKMLVELFPPSVYKYSLKSVPGNLKVVFPDLTAAVMKSYLVDVDTARRLGSVESRPIGLNGVGPVTTEDSITEQPQKLFDAILRSASQNPPVVLLEGVKPSTAPFVLEVRDEAGQQVFTTSLNLSLDGVEQMFRQKNLIKELSALEEVGGGYEEFFVPAVPAVGMNDRLQPDEFTNQIHFTGFDAENDGNDFIHVHGYNVNDEAARGEQAETFKRLYWSGTRARFWGITWYGWDSQVTTPIPGIDTRSPNYHVNVRHAFDSGRLLKDFVAASHLEHATFFAHSLGNMVVSSAIGLGMPIGRYLMVNAAVAEEAYTPEDSYDGGGAYAVGSGWRQSTKESMFHPAWRYPDGWEVDLEQVYLPFLWASEWYKLFKEPPGDGRATLTWRNIFAKLREKETYVYYSPTDEAFRPFNYTVEMAANDPNGTNYQPNVADWPGWEDVAQNWSPNNRSKLGTYSWAVQELFKGRFLAIADKDSDTGGWGFNLDPQDGYVFYGVHVQPNLADTYPPEQMKTKPFFSKNPEYGFLYTDQPAPVSATLREELLANELPALTFAAGHRGVKEIRDEHENRDIDIRQTFAVNKPWPVDRPRYEWRHSDIYVIAYPYLSGLYDELVKKTQGATP
jgi:hypothetical protein